MHDAYKLLQTIEQKAEKLSNHADFIFLIAIELHSLGLKDEAIEMLKRAISLSSMQTDYKQSASAALRLARWGVEDEAERIIESLPEPGMRNHYLGRLREIRDFARQSRKRSV
jgi:hypothetical protein